MDEEMRTYEFELTVRFDAVDEDDARDALNWFLDAINDHRSPEVQPDYALIRRFVGDVTDGDGPDNDGSYGPAPEDAYVIGEGPQQ